MSCTVETLWEVCILQSHPLFVLIGTLVGILAALPLLVLICAIVSAIYCIFVEEKAKDESTKN